MIWIITFGLCVAVFAYIAMPFYVKSSIEDDVHKTQKNEISAYRNVLKNIDSVIVAGEDDPASLAQQKTNLEKRLILSGTQALNLNKKTPLIWLSIIFIALIAGTFGTYSFIGSPNLAFSKSNERPVLSAPQALSQNAPDVQHENNASMADLVVGLEKKLQAGDQNPQRWGLYARSLMTLGRYEEAFLAYEKTLLLTDSNPEIAAELESARAFAAQQTTPRIVQPGPTREDVEAAAEMAPDDRAAMIQGMVEGLSNKLAENPNDPNGWVRLLRARKVLGQDEAAQKEILALKEFFKNDPKIIEDVLQQSGWGN